ncbi:tRNA pseudouridine(55) synthase TruB [Candidatus Saccharibacteria bacterium]|nr:tRNA pseudouridine(55) synthase TruB [Candidatus Saccharibacteria bacterium]
MENQIILVDKPAGVSSFGVVAKIRGRLKAELGHKVKVGHTGTLDPFATGLLIILTGQMTKKSNEFLKLDKVYEATLKLGYASTTGDPEGEITKHTQSIKSTKIEEHKGKICQGQILAAEGAKQCDKISDLSHCEASEISGFYTLNTIESTLKRFLGTITQTPPRFSAIKINGERAYKLARKNQDFEIPSRQVEIYSIDILDYHYPNLTIRTHVSSGTYIRTLAEDIGKALNTGAYLTALRRTRIGNYSVDNAIML